MDKNRKHAGKGWNRSLRTWMALARSAAERSVYRDLLKQPDIGEFLTHQDTVPLASGVDGKGKWWGKKD